MDTLMPELTCEAADALRSGRKSARRGRVEVLTGVERRRSWTVEQKREIVGESLSGASTPTEVARKHGISTGQLYTWREQLVGFRGAVMTRSAPRFAPVELSSSPPTPPDSAAVSPPVRRSSSSSLRPEGLIEIVLLGGTSVRVDAHVDARALRRVLGALEGR